MKKSLSKLILFILFCQMSSVALAKDFIDVSNVDVNYAAIKYLSDQNVLNGYEDLTFRPSQVVNRAETLKIVFLALAIGVKDEFDITQLFSDVKQDDWFAKYVVLAKEKGMVSGNGDGTFSPARTVTRAEFLKIMLSAAGFKKEAWENQQIYNDVPKDAWFATYLNYSGKSGLIVKDKLNNLYPQKSLTRGEVAEIIYLMVVILKGKDEQFLMDQAGLQMAQIENYLGNNNVANAKRSSDLAVDMTQQLIKLKPENQIYLGIAKIARAYNLLVGAFIKALEKDYVGARDLVEQTINKATEAWQVNHDTQEVAKHIKDKAAEILAQIEGK